MEALSSMLKWSSKLLRPSRPINDGAATRPQEYDSENEEHQDEEHRMLFVGPFEGRPKISEEDLCDNMTRERFKNLLENYPYYIREVYHDMEQDRFRYIPQRLRSLAEEGKPIYLKREELISMDRWIQKRGTPLKRRFHDLNAKIIAENSGKRVKDVTEKAFRKYQGSGESGRRSPRLARRSNQMVMDETGTGRVEDIIEAMRILENGLSGVKRARANLLLSIPFYKTVPFCSRELYRWLNWDEETGWAKQFKWTEDRFKQTIGTVRELARKFEVDAVAVEKVSFVLERNGLIERFKTESITRSVFDEGRPVTTLNTAVRRVSGRKVGIEKEEVAMKQIYTPGGISPRVLAEVIISNKLAQSSPDHFVEFYGWNQYPYFLSFAMELVEEGDLEANLMRNEEDPTRWTEPDIKSATKQILEGLGFMHDASIAHRDLKPHNILVVSSQPGRIRVKIGDFGVSKRLSERRTTSFRTRIGTEGYMAPEIAGGQRSESSNERRRPLYTFKVDIWSLGCVIYRMARGERPFTHNYSATDTVLPRKVNDIKRELGKRGKIGKTGVGFVCSLIKIKAEQRPDVREALESLGSWRLSYTRG